MTDSKAATRLTLLSRFGGAMALLGAFGVAGVSLSTWHDQRHLAETFAAGVPGAPLPEGGTLLVAYLVSLVPAAIFVIAMLEAWRLFRLLGGGRVFTPAMPAALVRLGGWAAASAIVGILVRTALGLVLTAGAPAGQKALIIAIGSGEIAALVMAALLLSFALVMRDAIALEQDSREII